MAVQRGLWRYLGGDARNIRNATYGEGTADDVALARKRLKVEGGSESVGQVLFSALWPYIDQIGRRRFATQPDACPTPPPHPKRIPLKKGMAGADVTAIKRALWRALEGDAQGSTSTDLYGDGTVHDVRLFRSRFLVNPDDPGTKSAATFWDVLRRWMDDYAVKLVEGYTRPSRRRRRPSWSSRLQRHHPVGQEAVAARTASETGTG
jgi:hypothetical protein